MGSLDKQSGGAPMMGVAFVVCFIDNFECCFLVNRVWMDLFSLFNLLLGEGEKAG